MKHAASLSGNQGLRVDLKLSLGHTDRFLMWYLASLALAMICLLVSIVSGAMGYKQISGRSGYCMVVFLVIFMLGFGFDRTMKFFGY